ncbi:MAG: DinB family protein [Ignavibacteria bacterium]
MRDHFLKLNIVNRWANKKVYNYLTSLNNYPEKINNYFSHIIAAEDIWIARMTQTDRNLKVWPEITLDEIGHFIEENYSRYKKFIETLDEDEFENLIYYNNTKGFSFSTSIYDILNQIFTHGYYHRGQINSVLRGNGFEPVEIDYIYYSRENN